MESVTAGSGAHRAAGDVPQWERGSALDRVAKTLVLVDRDGRGLEIGPAHSPMAPRAAGFTVDIVDHSDAETLRRTFREQGVADVDRVEDVDFVWRGETLPELVGGEDRYDWVIASHVLEHLPDPIAFLAGCERVLRPGGVLSLVLPDHRACFDHFRPLSTTGQLLDAHHRGDTRPSPGSVFDHVANAVTRGGAIAWDLAALAADPGLPPPQRRRPGGVPGARGPWALMFDDEQVRAHYRHARLTEDYMDAHVWTFVPDSFALLLQDLRALGCTTFGIVRAFDTTGHEFHASLRPGAGAGGGVDRLAVRRHLAGEG